MNITNKRIDLILKQLAEFKRLAYSVGDFNAADILLDIDDVVNNAKLSERQRQTYYYIYELGMTGEQTAAKIGITNESVRTHRRFLLNKLRNPLTEVFRYLENK